MNEYSVYGNETNQAEVRFCKRFLVSSKGFSGGVETVPSVFFNSFQKKKETNHSVSFSVHIVQTTNEQFIYLFELFPSCARVFTVFLLFPCDDFSSSS